MSASGMGMARSWVDWRRRNWLDVVEPQHRKKNLKKSLMLGLNSVGVCLVLLDVPRWLNLTETRGHEAAKREIGVVKFYKL